MQTGKKLRLNWTATDMTGPLVTVLLVTVPVRSRFTDLEMNSKTVQDRLEPVSNRTLTPSVCSCKHIYMSYFMYIKSGAHPKESTEMWAIYISWTICMYLHGHALSFTHFWCVYTFRLYVYTYLYGIATTCNATRVSPTTSHHLNAQESGVQMMSRCLGPLVNLLSFLT